MCQELAARLLTPTHELDERVEAVALNRHLGVVCNHLQKDLDRGMGAQLTGVSRCKCSHSRPHQLPDLEHLGRRGHPKQDIGGRRHALGVPPHPRFELPLPRLPLANLDPTHPSPSTVFFARVILRLLLQVRRRRG